MKFFVFYLLLFFVACSTSDKKETVVIARVGDETLTRENLLFLVGNQGAGVEAFSRATSRWVENRLLYDAAISVGLDKDFALKKERDLFYQSLLISSFIKIQMREKTKTTKKEVSDFYLKNKKSFIRADDEAVVKHFIFSTNKEAKSFKKELKKKKPKVDIERLLKNQQIETKTIKKKEAGSNLIDFVFTGSTGDVLGPKEHGGFFHLFQILQKHKEGSFLGLEKVYDEIYQRLYKEKESVILEKIIDSLYLNSDVYISQKSLIK